MPTSLTEFAKDYWPNLVGGLAGTAVGAGAGYVGTGRRPEESPEEFSARRKSNAGSGAIAGAAVGAGAPVALSAIKNLGGGEGAGPLRKIFGVVPGHPFIGAAGGATALGMAGRATNATTPGKPPLLTEEIARLKAPYSNTVDKIKTDLDAVTKRIHDHQVRQQTPLWQDVLEKQQLERRLNSAQAMANAKGQHLDDLLLAEERTSGVRKLLPTAAERGLRAEGVTARAFAGRTGFRRGGILGALIGLLSPAAPAIYNAATE